MQKNNTYDHKDVEIKKREVTHGGFCQLVNYRLRFRRFDGTWSEEIDRELYQRPNSSAMLLYDPHQDKVVLIEQFRPGALNYPGSPWLLEIPAGIMEDDENALGLAIRETKEETGLHITDTVFICDFFPSPGGLGEHAHLYCGKVNANEASGIHGLAHEHEDIKIHVFTYRKVCQLLNKGEIKNAFTIIALQWLRLNKHKLKKLWL